jgi:hypothetical protein
VSFDDGDHWQSLRLNMAASSVRDLVIKDDDLVVGTHGRGIWILDDITPLREIAEMTNATAGAGSATAFAEREVILFKPQPALRVRWNMNTDTPMPPDEPAGPNPPEGAIIDYYLKSAASGPVTLTIVGADGKMVRQYSSDDTVFRPDPATISIPPYWFRPLSPLSKDAGMHRVTWDLHYQPLPPPAGSGQASEGRGRGRGPSTGSGRGAGQEATDLGGPNLPIAAIGHNTVPTPTTPWVNPGTFTARLTVDGKTYSQTFTVKQDPRVKTPALAMQQIYTLSRAMYYEARAAREAERQAHNITEQIAKLEPQATGAVADALASLKSKVAGIGAVSTGLASVMTTLTAADVRPTTIQLSAIANVRTVTAQVMANWAEIKNVALPALNTKLAGAGLPAVTP